MATKKASKQKSTLRKIGETIGTIAGNIAVKKDQLVHLTSDAIDNVKSSIHDMTTPAAAAPKKAKATVKKAGKTAKKEVKKAIGKVKKKAAPVKKAAKKVVKKAAPAKKAIKKVVKKVAKAVKKKK
jgi:DNA-binding protein HU-beta